MLLTSYVPYKSILSKGMFSLCLLGTLAACQGPNQFELIN